MKNKKNILISILFAVIAAVVFVLLPFDAHAQNTAKQAVSKDDYEKLKKDLETIKADRDNLAIQAKSLLEKSKAQEEAPKQAAPVEDCEKLKKDYESIKTDRDNLAIQAKNVSEFRNKYNEYEAVSKKAKSETEQLKSDVETTQNQNLQLLQKLGEIEKEHSQTVKERDEFKKTLDKIQFEYKIVPETRRELSKLQGENSSMQKSVKQWQTKVKQLEDKKLNLEVQIEVYRMQLKDARKRYERAMLKNRQLEKKAQQLPKRFTEIARENKLLIKETSLMHYNLGVFYTKNKEFTRAMAEFEKTIELDPDDPAAYYNLGYIYAEYVLNRQKAIEVFRKFLSLTKSEDRDVDWVKKYILTWQTWEGKKPVE
jgi:tetratricopeptide (TPR) repeat protein